MKGSIMSYMSLVNFTKRLGVDEQNIDDYGLVVQDAPHHDGGDTCQRMNMLVVFYCLTNSDITFEEFENWYIYVLSLLQCPNKSNHYRRHPATVRWYSDCDRLSIDQGSALVIGMGFLRLNGRLRGFLWEQVKRFGFMTNTRGNGALAEKQIPDFGFRPEMIAHYIRGFRIKWLLPILWACDLETLGSSILWRFRSDNF